MLTWENFAAGRIPGSVREGADETVNVPLELHRNGDGGFCYNNGMKNVLKVVVVSGLLAIGWSAEGGFVRPQATRRYLHGPLSERVAVFFREGKLIWYTTRSEYQWSVAWRRVGRADLAHQSLEALLKMLIDEGRTEWK